MVCSGLISCSSAAQPLKKAVPKFSGQQHAVPGLLGSWFAAGNGEDWASNQLESPRAAVAAWVGTIAIETTRKARLAQLL